MINGDSSGETGGLQPGREELEPESLEFIANFLNTLGPDGVEALLNIELAERDLRTISFLDPKFAHALDRAEQLLPIRIALKELLDRAADIEARRDMPQVAARGFGRAALNHLSRLTHFWRSEE